MADGAARCDAKAVDRGHFESSGWSEPPVRWPGESPLSPLQFLPVEANPKGYNFPVHVTKGHEREAMEAQRRKKPSSIGKIVLRLLGFKGEVGSDYVE